MKGVRGVISMILMAVVLLFSVLLIEGICGELNTGLSYIPMAHSEQEHDRCMNDGYAVDVGWLWKPVEHDFHKLFGVELGAGVLGTYSNIESAYRVTSTSPESKQKRESAFTMLGVIKPAVRIWRIKPFLLLGAGPDWSTNEGLDVGYLEFQGNDQFPLVGSLVSGVDVELTDTMSLGYSERKLNRSGSFYKYRTVSFTMTF
jgi:hypothetical protein